MGYPIEFHFTLMGLLVVFLLGGMGLFTLGRGEQRRNLESYTIAFAPYLVQVLGMLIVLTALVLWGVYINWVLGLDAGQWVSKGVLSLDFLGKRVVVGLVAAVVAIVTGYQMVGRDNRGAHSRLVLLGLVLLLSVFVASEALEPWVGFWS